MTHHQPRAGAGHVRPRALTVGVALKWAALLAAAALVTVWVGHLLIAAVYRGELLPGLLENKATKPLDYYYGVIDRTVLMGFFVIGMMLLVTSLARTSAVSAVLIALLAGDVILCAVGERYGGFLDVRLDGGIPEWFQYYKEAGIAFLLFRLYRTTARRIFLGWSCLYGFLLLDDALKYHERVGALIGRFPGLGTLAAAAEVRAADIGEMLAVAPVFLALLFFLAWPYLRERPDGRAIVHRFAALLGALVLMGGVMDLIDRVAVSRGSDMVQVLSLIEDGGEMLVLSFTFAYALTVFRRYRVKDGY